MSTWGTGLWDNDTASDIKNEIKKCLKYSHDDDDAIKKFYALNEQLLSDSDDGPIAVMVLAMQMWNYGRLTNELKAKAHKAAEAHMLNIQAENDTSFNSKHKKAVEKYLEKLDSPQPPIKNIKRHLPFENNWAKGDVLAVKCRTPLLLRKSDDSPEEIFQGGHIILIYCGKTDRYPLFYSKYCDKVSVKKGMDISSYPFIIGFFHETGTGDKPVYRTELMIDGADQEKKMLYLGNYDNIDFPSDDDKEMINTLPFELLAEYSAKSYFHCNLHYNEAKAYYK